MYRCTGVYGFWPTLSWPVTLLFAIVAVHSVVSYPRLEIESKSKKVEGNNTKSVSAIFFGEDAKLIASALKNLAAPPSPGSLTGQVGG